MTNLVATVVVTLITNVLQSDNTIWSTDPSILVPSRRVALPPTEQYETTVVSERKHIEFEYEGRKITYAVSERELFRNKVTSQIVQLWKPTQMEHTTNEVIQGERGIMLTNSSRKTIVLPEGFIIVTNFARPK